jgi:hypothetical protein
MMAKRMAVSLTYSRHDLVTLVMNDAGVQPDEIVSEEWNSDGVTLTLKNDAEVELPE